MKKRISLMLCNCHSAKGILSFIFFKDAEVKSYMSSRYGDELVIKYIIDIENDFERSSSHIDYRGEGREYYFEKSNFWKHKCYIKGRKNRTIVSGLLRNKK